jgi:integrase/recombinase XerD
MATVKIVLDQRRIKKDNTFPVVIRVRYLKKYFDLKTFYHVPKNKFDEKKQQIIGDAEANYHIEELKEKYSKRIREYLKNNTNIAFEINDLKLFVQQKPSELVTIEEFWNDLIKQLNDTNRTGSARSYKTTLSVFSKIIDCKRTFYHITYKDLITIETILLKRGVSINGVAVYMRTFRAVCNRAILYNLATYEWYPFRKYKIKKERTTPRVINITEMHDYFNLNIIETDVLYKAWCIGKLIFMLRGINMTDLLLLKKSNIHQDRIIYKRQKTGKMYTIKIVPEVQELFNRFSNETQNLIGFVNTYNRKDTAQELNQYIHYRKRLNKKLKQIGELLNLSEPLTSYVFRYSYANIAKQLGYSKDLIAEALGHEYGNSVTGIYLELFDNEIVDNMNQQIIQSVIKKRVV